MPTYTTNYDIPKPLVNSAVDQDLWGDELNDGMDIIDTQLKVNADAIAAVSAALYPVGSVYMNYSDNTDPGTLLGFGTWTSMQDRVLIGAGGTYAAGSTGGATTVALTSANNGPHTHTMNNDQGGAGTANFVASAAGSATAVATSSSGSGTPFSILNPYVAVYMWRRTA